MHVSKFHYVWMVTKEDVIPRTLKVEPRDLSALSLFLITPIRIFLWPFFILITMPWWKTGHYYGSPTFISFIHSDHLFFFPTVSWTSSSHPLVPSIFFWFLMMMVITYAIRGYSMILMLLSPWLWLQGVQCRRIGGEIAVPCAGGGKSSAQRLPLPIQANLYQHWR